MSKSLPGEENISIFLPFFYSVVLSAIKMICHSLSFYHRRKADQKILIKSANMVKFIISYLNI